MPVGGFNNLLISTSQYLHTSNFQVIGGLRIPKVYVVITPDNLLPGNQASPSVSEYSLNEGGTNKLALTVRVPKSIADTTGAVEFKLPVYAVDSSGLLAQANSIFPARLDAPQISNLAGDAVMVNGKGYVTVRVPINIASTIDFTRFSLGPNAACGSDNTTALSFNRLYLNGCTMVTATNDVPGNAPQLQAFSFPATSATLSKFNRISYGTTAKEQTDYFKNVKDTSVEVARFLFNFVPFLSDGIDFGTQVINAATGQNVDNVLLVMASAGLILDATTGGVGDVTAIFKAIYKESRRLGGIFADVIAGEVGQLLSGKTAGQVIDALKVRFKVVLRFGDLNSGCGLLGIDCFRQYDELGQGYKTERNLTSANSLNQLDSDINDPTFETLKVNSKERLEDLASCPIGASTRGDLIGVQAVRKTLICGTPLTPRTEVQITDRVTGENIRFKRPESIEATIILPFEEGRQHKTAANKIRDNAGLYDANGRIDDSCHIISKVFGGSGSKNNVFPCESVLNQVTIGNFEKALANYVRNANLPSFKFRVSFEYPSATSARPSKIKYEYFAPDGSRISLPGYTNPQEFINPTQRTP